MSPNADNNDTNVSFSENADVEGGVPVAVADAPAQAPADSDSATLRATKDRQSLSMSKKAWDIDGDGQLDDTELALKGLDKSGKGTLSKEQMYQLMHQNLAVQKELSVVKKVVYGLVGFTVVLALANVGTSFAAAFLAKDTKMEDGKLKGMDGSTVQTDTAFNTFEAVDDEKAKEIDDYRRELACILSDNGLNGNNFVQDATECEAQTTVGGTAYLSQADGAAFVQACRTGGSASIKKTYSLPGGGTGETEHHYCGSGKHSSLGTPNFRRGRRRGGTMYLDSVSNQGALGWDMKVRWDRNSDHYRIFELKSLVDQFCDTGNDNCATGQGTCDAATGTCVVAVAEAPAPELDPVTGGGGDPLCVATGSCCAASGAACCVVGDWCGGHAIPTGTFGATCTACGQDTPAPRADDPATGGGDPASCGTKVEDQTCTETSECACGLTCETSVFSEGQMVAQVMTCNPIR